MKLIVATILEVEVHDKADAEVVRDTLANGNSLANQRKRKLIEELPQKP